ncbi:hypothetical protein BDV95DRAFT_172554 [Massariosphaeria phaeospora]|uniref:Methyltransferase domain-containing protein n=1 Tax=Massariosphaeria phaeospora TaxID=100035 RepID=A0A7C8M3V6_9PLEO|nr:hypothetical protein BDV95DRAFT_172554 [Massariosphaeria phaeospora]
MVQNQDNNVVQQNERAPWWHVKELTELSLDARELFENYSKVPSDNVLTHITEARNKAFKVFPYPCLGRFAFLALSVRQTPRYDEILNRIKNGDKYLDLGCCVGQDIRKLVYDGAPSENTYGVDLMNDFMEIGYDLFLDKATLKTTFMAADVFEKDSELNRLDGEIDIVHAASFFHLFGWEGQLQAAKRMVSLVKPKPGSLIVGRHIGNINPGEEASKFMHDADSFALLWKQVGEETATSWEVDARLGDKDLAEKTGSGANSVPEDTRWLSYTVRRL